MTQAAAYALDKGYMHSDGRYFAPDAGVPLASVYQALSGMAFCYYAGLMTGDQNHALQPNRALTRAEFAQLVMNLDRYLAGQPAAA